MFFFYKRNLFRAFFGFILNTFKFLIYYLPIGS